MIKGLNRVDAPEPVVTGSVHDTDKRHERKEHVDNGSAYSSTQLADDLRALLEYYREGDSSPKATANAARVTEKILNKASREQIGSALHSMASFIAKLENNNNNN